MDEPTSAPKAQGNLAKTPFSHLVIYLYQQRSTGTLLVATSGVAADGSGGAPTMSHALATRILFRRGRAVAAHLLEAASSLEEGLLPLCELHDAPFEFYDEDIVGTGTEILTGMFDPHAFVAMASRRYPRADIVDEVLGRFDGMRLRVQMGVDVDRLRLNRAEAALIDVLRAEPSDVESLCSLSELTKEDTRRLLYILIVTKLVTAYEARNPESFASHVREREGEREPWIAPGAAVNKAPMRRGSESVVANNPLFSSKPPAQTAGSGQGQPTAWQTLAVRAAQAGSLRPPASASTSLFKSVRPTSETPRPSMAPPETLDANGKQKRVDQLFQRSAYDEALPLIRGLVAEDPNSAKYHALLGYALLMRNNELVSKEIIDEINQALRLDEDEPRALFTKAMSYKRMSRDREALHYFKRTVSVDPAHIEAAREIRLLGLRAAEEKKAEKKPKR